MPISRTHYTNGLFARCSNEGQSPDLKAVVDLSEPLKLSTQASEARLLDQ